MEIEQEKSLAVANLIIQIANEHDKPVTNMKLQKVMFFIQGYCLAVNGKELINDKFMKSQYGVIIKGVYPEFKWFLSDEITSGSVRLRKNNGNLELYQDEVNQKTKDELTPMIEKIINLSTIQLGQMIKGHASWKNHEEAIINGDAKDYTSEEIKQCFVDNQHEF